jgi:iron complex outermembrane recepter protein
LVNWYFVLIWFQKQSRRNNLHLKCTSGHFFGETPMSDIRSVSLRHRLLVSTSVAMLATSTAWAQVAPKPAEEDTGLDTIIVTAQRQSQSVQDVPIAVSAFGAEQLQKSGIEGAADIQFALPNVTFTKSNFTSQSFQIRGVGSNAVGASTEGSTGIHINDIPVGSARIFETEFFDVERVEVLRGPQGTQFGRNATGGVLNVITRKPTDEFEGQVELEYGNFQSIKVKGALNVPLGETAGIRLAGTYLNRDGFTKNLFTNSNIDGRNQYALRGTLEWNPGDNTQIDFTVQHFEEKSDRSRTGKQLCNRDVTGIYGCLPDRLEYETSNGNAFLSSILPSRQFLSVALANNLRGTPLAGAVPQIVAGLALTDLTRADSFAGVVNPADLRTVSVDYAPTYKSNETLVQLAFKHDFEKASFKVNAGWAKTGVDSTTDYTISVQNPLSLPVFIGNPALAAPFGLTPAVTQLRNALFQGNNIGVSNVQANSRETYSGFIGGNILGYAPNGIDYDRSVGATKELSVEGILTSKFDGPLNVLVGAIYSKTISTQVDYYVASSGLDYAAAVLAFPSGSALAAPFFNNETSRYTLKGIAGFGEVYYQATEDLKFTIGLRYLKDEKFVRDRSVLLNTPVPYGTTNALPALRNIDANVGIAGIQEFREQSASFKRLTGRAVIDWKPELAFTDDTLIYASYSRGFKSGGINPPFDAAIFPNARTAFGPETINAFEVGTKNRFNDGTVQINLTGFYYSYKDLQISSIIQRTTFNDNVNATIYGVELETLWKPINNLVVGATASYLKTKIGNRQILDPSNVTAGRSDVLVIKDLQSAAQCVVEPGAAGTNVEARLVQISTFYSTLLPAVNGALANPLLPAATRAQLTPLAGGLAQVGPAAGAAGSTAFTVPGAGTRGNYGLCAALRGLAATYGGAAATAQAFGLGAIVPGASLGVNVTDGVLTDITGNELQNSPNFKFSASLDYTYPLKNDLALNFRVDYAYTGKQFGSIFNRGSNAQTPGGACTVGGNTVVCGDKLPAFSLVNAQFRLSGPDDKWALRAFVQNVFNKQAITGLYTTDQNSGLFRNAFLADPRRFGLAAELKF